MSLVSNHSLQPLNLPQPNINLQCTIRHQHTQELLQLHCSDQSIILLDSSLHIVQQWNLAHTIPINNYTIDTTPYITSVSYCVSTKQLAISTQDSVYVLLLTATIHTIDTVQYERWDILYQYTVDQSDIICCSWCVPSYVTAENSVDTDAGNTLSVLNQYYHLVCCVSDHIILYYYNIPQKQWQLYIKIPFDIGNQCSIVCSLYEPYMIILNSTDTLHAINVLNSHQYHYSPLRHNDTVLHCTFYNVHKTPSAPLLLLTLCVDGLVRLWQRDMQSATVNTSLSEQTLHSKLHTLPPIDAQSFHTQHNTPTAAMHHSQSTGSLVNKEKNVKSMSDNVSFNNTELVQSMYNITTDSGKPPSYHTSHQWYIVNEIESHQTNDNNDNKFVSAHWIHPAQLDTLLTSYTPRLSPLILTIDMDGLLQIWYMQHLLQTNVKTDVSSFLLLTQYNAIDNAKCIQYITVQQLTQSNKSDDLLHDITLQLYIQYCVNHVHSTRRLQIDCQYSTAGSDIPEQWLTVIHKLQSLTNTQTSTNHTATQLITHLLLPYAAQLNQQHQLAVYSITNGNLLVGGVLDGTSTPVQSVDCSIAKSIEYTDITFCPHNSSIICYSNQIHVYDINDNKLSLRTNITNSGSTDQLLNVYSFSDTQFMTVYTKSVILYISSDSTSYTPVPIQYNEQFTHVKCTDSLQCNNRSYIVCGHRDGWVAMYYIDLSISTLQLINTFKPFDQPVTHIKMASNGCIVCYCSEINELSVYQHQSTAGTYQILYTYRYIKSQPIQQIELIETSNCMLSVMTLSTDCKLMLHQQQRVSAIPPHTSITTCKYTPTFTSVPITLFDSMGTISTIAVHQSINILMVECTGTSKTPVIFQCSINDIIQPAISIRPIYHPDSLYHMYLNGSRHLLNNILLQMHQSLCVDNQHSVNVLPVHDILPLTQQQIKSVDNSVVQPVDNGAFNMSSWSTGFGIKHNNVSSSTNNNINGSAANESKLVYEITQHTVDDTMLQTLVKRLQTIELSTLQTDEQLQLAQLITVLIDLYEFERTMDVYALRYLLTARYHNKLIQQQLISSDTQLYTFEMLYSLHTQSNIDTILQLIVGERADLDSTALTWTQVQSLGIGYYISGTRLCTLIERLAINQYKLKRSPVDCMMFYIALNKLGVLLGLMKTNSKYEQIYILLSSDFTVQSNKSTAMENGFRALSLRKYHTAIGFMLLAGNIRDAVTVCIRQLNDVQLALVLCRLYMYNNPGCDSELLDNIISTGIIPHAIDINDNGLLHICYVLLKQYDKSINVLCCTDSVSTTHPATSALITSLHNHQLYKNYADQRSITVSKRQCAYHYHIMQHSILALIIMPDNDMNDQPVDITQVSVPKQSEIKPTVSFNDSGRINMSSFGGGGGEFGRRPSTPPQQSNTLQQNGSGQYPSTTAPAPAFNLNNFGSFGMGSRNHVAPPTTRNTQSVDKSDDKTCTAVKLTDPRILSARTQYDTFMMLERQWCIDDYVDSIWLQQAIQLNDMLLSVAHNRTAAQICDDLQSMHQRYHTIDVNRTVHRIIATCQYNQLIHSWLYVSSAVSTDAQSLSDTLCNDLSILNQWIRTLPILSNTNNAVLHKYAALYKSTAVTIQQWQSIALQYQSCKPESLVSTEWCYITLLLHTCSILSSIIYQDWAVVLNTLESCFANIPSKNLKHNYSDDHDHDDNSTERTTADPYADLPVYRMKIDLFVDVKYKLQLFIDMYLVYCILLQYNKNLIRTFRSNKLSATVELLGTIQLLVGHTSNECYELFVAALNSLLQHKQEYEQPDEFGDITIYPISDVLQCMSSYQLSGNGSTELNDYLAINDILNVLALDIIHSINPLHSLRSSDIISSPIELYKLHNNNCLPQCIAINQYDQRWMVVATLHGLRELHTINTILYNKYNDRHELMIEANDSQISSWHAHVHRYDNIDRSTCISNTLNNIYHWYNLSQTLSSCLQSNYSEPNLTISPLLHTQQYNTLIGPAIKSLLTSGQVINHDIVVISIDTHPQLPLYVTGTATGRIYMWHYAWNNALTEFNTTAAYTNRSDRVVINNIKFDESGNKLYACTGNGKLLVWNCLYQHNERSNDITIQSSECIDVHCKVAKDFILLDNSSIIVTCGDSYTSIDINIFNMLLPLPERLVGSFQCHDIGTINVLCSINSHIFIAAAAKGSLYICDINTLSISITIETIKQQRVQCMQYSTDKQLLYCGCYDGTLRIYSLQHSSKTNLYSLQLQFELNNLHVRSSIFSSGGMRSHGITSIKLQQNRLYTCGADGTVKLMICR